MNVQNNTTVPKVSFKNVPLKSDLELVSIESWKFPHLLIYVMVACLSIFILRGYLNSQIVYGAAAKTHVFETSFQHARKLPVTRNKWQVFSEY